MLTKQDLQAIEGIVQGSIQKTVPERITHLEDRVNKLEKQLTAMQALLSK